MADTKQLQNLQDEIKLLKGELKNSLASVRDYLLNMELPSSEFSTILAALGDSGEQRITMKGSFSAPPENKPKPVEEPQDMQEETLEEYLEEPEESEHSGEADELAGEEEAPVDEGPFAEDTKRDEPRDFSEESFPEEPYPADTGQIEELPEQSYEELPEQEPEMEPELDQEDDYATMPEAGLSEEEEFAMDLENQTAELNPSVPRVNMLANLINWVSRIKSAPSLGALGTYPCQRSLFSPKDVILHLAEMSTEQVDAPSNAVVWSQAMLSLHGILTGGDSPRYPVIPSWSDVSSQLDENEEEIIEVDKAREPVRLKLVLPDGNGQSQEFSIDLNPHAESNGSSGKGDKK